MTRRKVFGFALLHAALGLALMLPSTAAAQGKEAPVRLGMAETFFTDIPPAIVQLVTGPFEPLMKETTGLVGKLSHDESAFKTAAALDAGSLQFGVFHGHEFAWIQKKYPKVKPVLIVSNKEHDVRAFVIVHKDSPAKVLTDLRGKVVDMPMPTKEFSRAFVAKHCSDNGQKPIFKEVVKSDSPNAALDDLCRRKSDAVLIDAMSLEFYKAIKGPVFNNNLRVLAQSEMFPPAVIAYKEGALKDATLKQFREGLLQAHTNQQGKALMLMWNIDGFELPPQTLGQMLADSLKAYPSPEPTKVGLR
ncbi:MAG: PhnD/SsuA/transferrin family substrate-binding protein [Planctomycetes bacterium]|nr:PhnD/SsuA/transferrin family substrate-binding protein [Planctomycetota bacterium]